MAQLYDKIGVEYDSTRACDPTILSTLCELLNASGNATILDIACGTGNYTIGLSNKGYNMVGVDISDTMLQSAQRKCSKVQWRKGNVNNLPFPNSMFDGCVCTLACHHFGDLQKAFSEVYRIMNHGRFVILSCSHSQVKNYWLYRYFPNEMETMLTYMPDVPDLIDALCVSGFRIIRVDPFYITENLTDNFLGARFEQPELYLQKSFRDGMSIFAHAADPSSVAEGCERLRADIQSGEYTQFILNHRNPIGDYCFVTAEKV